MHSRKRRALHHPVVRAPLTLLCGRRRYETSTPNKPYQTFMLLFSVSSVAMIMEYLILVPEYFDERPIFVSERKVSASQASAKKS